MRLRINSLRFGTVERQITLTPGLNIVTGPVASGKTTFLRLCRVLLGARVNHMIPEVKLHVPVISGRVEIGDNEFSLVRRVVSTPDAFVDIAGLGVALRLPAIGGNRDTEDFGDWLLNQLGLPRLEVPRAPTKADSDPSRVSVADFLMYCTLLGDTIDSTVFHHTDQYRNIKRKYVFEILYGFYGIETARLQAELRSLDRQLRAFQMDLTALEQLLADTPWENRASLESELDSTARSLQQEQFRAQDIATRAGVDSRVVRLREQTLALDDGIARAHTEIDREQSAIDRLEELRAQLSSQSARLTRSIVADDLLIDYEFLRCPRCGSEISSSRGNDDICHLCLQVPGSTPVQRIDLIREKDRIESQITETRELVREHRSVVADRQAALERLSRERTQLAVALDFQMRSYVSDQADAIAVGAAESARLQQTLQRLRDYMQLFERFDSRRAAVASLEARREEVEASLNTDESARSAAWEKVAVLERYLNAELEAFRAPELQSSARSLIDRTTYLPVFRGRPFDTLSSEGLKVMVNVAHVVAQQRAAIELELPLPNILLIDGLSSNIGREGMDRERIEGIYESLIRLHETYSDRLQIIVTDHQVPEVAAHYVRLQLSESDRLVPDVTAQ